MILMYPRTVMRMKCTDTHTGAASHQWQPLLLLQHVLVPAERHSKPRAPLQHVLVPAERHSKPRAPLQHALVLAERHSKPRAPRTLQGTQPATSLSSKTRKSLNTYTRCKKSLERLLCTYANRSETKWNRQFHRKEQNLQNRYRNLMQANFHRGSKES